MSAAAAIKCESEAFGFRRWARGGQQAKTYEFAATGRTGALATEEPTEE
jgi:hypothetical protein